MMPSLSIEAPSRDVSLLVGNFADEFAAKTNVDTDIDIGIDIASISHRIDRRNMLNRVHLALLHAIALALFAHGFLLTRVHLPRERYSSAGGAPAGGGGLHHDARGRDGHFEGRGASVENGVGQPARQASMPSYRKLVWVVVDALRYDFVVDDARYGHSKRNADMPFLSSFVRGQDCLDGASHPGCGRDVAEYARVARFIADAPTTTTQRLMSMTTGSLPIFFDVSSAFSASAVGEDNLIDGLRSAGRRLVFMGDSTWDSLYPTQFHASYPFPCYNIMDLHSVDEGGERAARPGSPEHDGW